MAIRQYESPISSIRPSEVGVEATAAAARRAGGFFSQSAAALRALGSETAAAGEQTARMVGSSIRDAGAAAVDYAQHREIAHGAAADAGLTDKLTNAWNDTVKNADPNDPTVAAKFREQVMEPELQKFGESFLTEGGQKFAEQRVERLRNHLFEKTSADMATLAGAAVTDNIRTIANTRSNTAVNDPSAVPHLLSTIDADVNDVIASSPNLKGAAATKARIELTEKMREQIVKSGALSAIQKSGDPEATATAWTSKYPEYVNGAEALQFAKFAHAQNKANLATDIALKNHQHTEEVRAADTALSKTLTDNVTFDANGKATIKPSLFKSVLDTEMKYPGAATARSQAIINWAQSQQKEHRETVVTDPATQSALYTGLFNTNKPTTDVDIYKAAAENKLDAHATSVLLNLNKSLEEAPLKGPIYQGTMAAVKGVLGDSEKGHENYAKFLQTFIPEYLKKQRDGTLPPNALDIRDDKSLISQSLAPWRLTPQEKMMGQMFKRLGLGGDMGQGFDPVKLLNPDATAPKSAELPPVDKRVKDKTYDTPRGKMKWTGTGWVAP